MKLHYQGKFNGDEKTLPHGEHMPNAVPFKEAKDAKTMAEIATVISIVVMIVLAIPAWLIAGNLFEFDGFFIVLVLSMLVMYPHELLHAICFKEDVYMYTNLKQGMMFVVGPEIMTRSRFVFMSLLPNLVLGIVPYVLGLVFPEFKGLLLFGIINCSSGAGDYYNVFNAMTQMPKGAKTYLYQFNSYWFIPEK